MRGGGTRWRWELDPAADYQQLRRQAALYDLPDRSAAITGPDAERLLSLVFSRDVSRLPRPGCCSIACDDSRAGACLLAARHRPGLLPAADPPRKESRKLTTMTTAVKQWRAP